MAVGGSEGCAELPAVTGMAASGAWQADPPSGVGMPDSKGIAVRMAWCSFGPLT